MNSEFSRKLKDFFLSEFSRKLKGVNEKLITINLYLVFRKTATFAKARALLGIDSCIQTTGIHGDLSKDTWFVRKILKHYPQLRELYEKAMKKSMDFLSQPNHQRVRELIVRNLWHELELSAWIQTINVDESFAANRAFRLRQPNDCKGLSLRKKALGVI